ncbi:MAG: REP element-mobilizing transposase RayT [Ilumatobacter sp.]|jgi:REP element-mobilizing transposase RayT
MGREHRVDIEGGWYHVMNRGVNRQMVFFDDADRVEFGRLLGVIHERFGVRVIAYCLMTNHYHLVLHCPEGGLSDAMHLFGSVLTRHINERVGRDGPLFRGRFHSVVIDSDGQLLVSVRYVHRNPLDIGGISAAEEYRWSSHRTYLGHRHVPQFLDPNPVLDHFGGDVHAFRSFVDDEVRSNDAGAIPSLDQLSRLVNLVADEMLPIEIATSQVTRTVLVTMIDMLAPPSQKALAKRLGFSTEKSQHQARRRAAERVQANPLLGTVACRVLELLAEDELVPGTRSSAVLGSVRGR